MAKWFRYRFKTRSEDYRPVLWPPPGPYWCSGEGDDYWILIAWFPAQFQISDYWPEAEDLESTEEGPPIYTDRFPKPDWIESAAQGKQEAGR